MSNYENKPGSGAIFKNNKQNEKQPDYRGTIYDLSGKECSISLWLKTSEKGTKYFSVSIQEAYRKEESKQGEHPYISGSPNADDPREATDDLPF